MARLLRRRHTTASVLAASAVAVVAGGGGWALGATGKSKPKPAPKVIRACASKKTGALRVARKCSRRERKLSWSVVGPMGPAGSAGAAGAAGQQGPGATALRFSDQASAALAGTVIARVGGYSFLEQCQQQTAGDQVLVSVQNPDRWLGLGSLSQQTLPTQTTATTTLTSLNASDGSLRGIAQATTPPNQSGQASVELELVDRVTNQVLDVHLAVLVDGSANLCTGAGAAIPAS
jgi:hypothetical protein